MTEHDTDKAGPEQDSGSVRERVVIIRDKRKIDATGQPKPAESAGPAGGDATGQDGAAEPAMGQPANAGTGEPAANSAEEGEVVAGEVITETGYGPFQAELDSLRTELDERVRDLQRLSAEYANYRKRIDRDRGAMVEQASGLVISALLPILDDLDRAREHDDLIGPAAAMADQLGLTLAKFGLTGFGEVGDAFDPTRHEAVAHENSSEVTEPTCVSVMRRGYLLGDRLLRAALVGVADPE
jgi:molecular chaperone GrpE